MTVPDPTRRWLSVAFKLLIAVVVTWFIYRTVRDAWAELSEYDWDVRPAWLLFAGGLYLAGLLPAGLFWHRALLALGQSPRVSQTLRAYFIGHLGKYVPGKAMVVVLRAGLLRRGGVDTAAAAVSVFYETLTMMAVGAFLAATLLAVWFRDQWFLAAIALGLMVAAVAPTLPPVVRRLAKLAGVGRRDPEMLVRLDRLGFGALAVGWITMAAGWVVMGLSLWATLRGLGIETANGRPADPLGLLPFFTAVVSLAMVAGFLSLIPGGALVRESVIVGLMSEGEFHTADAFVAAVFLRLVWLAAELGVSALLCFGRPDRSRHDAA